MCSLFFSVFASSISKKKASSWSNNRRIAKTHDPQTGIAVFWDFFIPIRSRTNRWTDHVP
jgi:hypothetical protein